MNPKFTALEKFVVLFISIILLVLLLSLRQESPINRQIRLVKEKAAQSGWIDERKERD